MSNSDLLEQSYRERQSEKIVGSSPALKSALLDVERVAPTDTTVLVLGETGTGKELFAHAIHKFSPRCEQPFIKLDCAAIRFDLLESELFGHEKGAFTGAIAQKVGRFEMADTGTLFLDEIGDLPLALQPKLLRILEEQEFERPGTGRTLRVNVRLIAATHRDLGQMVRQREFRSDLYYRLNCFPIVLPPLRERLQDIPLLVSHFVEMFSSRFGKHIRDIPDKTLSAFCSHNWPGNVRELQNLVKRAVILSNDGVLPNPLPVSTKSSRITHQTGASNDCSQSNIRSRCIEAPDTPSISNGHSAAFSRASDHQFSSSSADVPIVFAVDHDPAVRGSMERLIRQQGWLPETFSCVREFLDRPRAQVPNCVILDVALQDLNGLEMQKRIALERADTPVIFTASAGQVPASVQAIKAGAVEFLIRPFSDQAFADAIRDGLKRSSITLGRETEMRVLRGRYASLSHREKQVMALVASGLLNKQVGAELGISEITVKAHRGKVMQKLGAKSVADLVRMATKLRSEHASQAAALLSSSLPFQVATPAFCQMAASGHPAKTELIGERRKS